MEVKNAKTKLKSQSGFTLVEVLVAVSILGVGMAGIFAALNANLKSAALVRNNYIAAGLVQEGIEVVRNLRDSEWGAGAAWGTVAADCAACSVQYDSTVLGGAQGSFLKKSASGLYGYAGGTDTPFKRTVAITTMAPNVEKRVIVTLTWTERKQPKSVSAEEHLFNWYRP